MSSHGAGWRQAGRTPSKVCARLQIDMKRTLPTFRCHLTDDLMSDDAKANPRLFSCILTLTGSPLRFVLFPG